MNPEALICNIRAIAEGVVTGNPSFAVDDVRRIAAALSAASDQVARYLFHRALNDEGPLA